VLITVQSISHGTSVGAGLCNSLFSTFCAARQLLDITTFTNTIIGYKTWAIYSQAIVMENLGSKRPPMVSSKRQIRTIWMMSREYGDLAGAGGVKDVVAQLSRALARWSGRSVSVVLPRYGFIEPIEAGFSPLADPHCPKQHLQLAINMHLPDQSVTEEVSYYFKRQDKVNIYLVDAQRFSDKTDIYTYSAADERQFSWKKESVGHYDYFAMNVLHQKAALELMIALSVRPDIIHCHDGHTAILPALVRESSGYSSYFRCSACLVTLHNGGYGYHQEVDDLSYAQSTTGLPRELIDNNLLEQKFDPLLLSGQYATMNTVSENYARELQYTQSDQLTGWLGHELRSRGVVLHGITNGIDPELYSPEQLSAKREELLFDPGSADDQLKGKENCKEALLEELRRQESFSGMGIYGRLDAGDQKILFTFLGRLTEQKGINTLLEVLPVLFTRYQDAQMVVLGNGAVELESRLIDLTDHPLCHGRICYLKGYNPKLARQIYAAGDFFVVPSRFEPCGLTDFIAQLHGNIPVVHHVGGLVKVVDGKTGIAYQGDGPEDLLMALERAARLTKEARREMQYRAVKTIEERYTWTKVMQKYIELYKISLDNQVKCQ
jgi:starch synthase